MRRYYRLLALGFGAAGYSKLMAQPQQRRLFRSWGWPEDVMLIIGGLELGGALLMSSRRTRHVGAATVAATSVAVLAAEIEHGQQTLTTARAAMLLAALTALAPVPAKRSSSFLKKRTKKPLHFKFNPFG